MAKFSNNNLTTIKIPLEQIREESGNVRKEYDWQEIENLAKTNPEKIIKYYPQPLIDFLPYEAREIARKMEVPSELIGPMGDVIWKLYNVFDKYDCEIAEINPLVLTPDG